MQHNWTRLLLVLVTYCNSGTAPLLAQSGQQPGSNNLAAWNAINKAYTRCDAAAKARSVEGTLAIDMATYKVVDVRGKVLYANGPKMVAQYRKTYEGATQVMQRTTLQKLSLQTGLARATILQHLELSAIDPSINNWRTWVIDWRMEDVWEQHGGAWKRKTTIMLNQTSAKRIGPISN